LTENALKTIEYLKSIGCIVEHEVMIKTIKNFGYQSTQEVIAIDGHVMALRTFEDFANNWQKIIRPRLGDEHVEEGKQA